MQPFSVFLVNSFSYEYEQQRLFYALQFQNIVVKNKSLRMHDWASYFKNVSINIWKATIILLSEVPNSVSKIQKALESTI